MQNNFEKLDAWKKARELCLICYQVALLFPEYERYGLSDQLRRASVSVPSNIAEGYSRRSTKELFHFLSISIGSIYEIITQVDIALQLGYINKEKKMNVDKTAEEAIKLINGFIKYKKGKLNE